jgi:hypothetical protein
MATLITEPPRLIRVEDAAKLLNVGCSADLDRGAPAATGPDMKMAWTEVQANKGGAEGTRTPDPHTARGVLADFG